MSHQVPMDQFEGLGMLPLIIMIKVAAVGAWVETLLPQRQYDATTVATRRRKEACELGISLGTKRDGMDDTGSNVIANRQFVKMGVFLAEIGLLGYRVTDASWFWREDERGRKRFLQVVYTRTGERIELPSRVVELFRGTAQFCNVWCNVRESSDGDLFRLDTVNVPTPRNMVAEEELHASFNEGRYTYLTTAPR